MSTAINKVSDAFNLFETTLKTAISSLENKDQIAVERLITLDKYRLSHPRGTFGLLYNGAQYEQREDVKGGVVVMKRNMLIGVVSIIKFYDNSKAPISQYSNMIPSDYVEIATDALTGLEVDNKRSMNERKIFPVRDELVDEENGIWKYLTTFSIPVDFIETTYRNQI